MLDRCFPYDLTVNIEDIFSRPSAVRGIIAIKNLKTGRTLLEKTEDAVASFKSERFNLDLSMHPNKELQKEYTALGLELFTIELEKEADEDDNLDALLEECKKHCLQQGNELY